MKKITELKVVRYRTTHMKDAFGNRHRDREKYIARREVKSISPGPRFGHFLIDLICFRAIVFALSFVLGLVLGSLETNPFLQAQLYFVVVLLYLVLWPFLYGLCEYLFQRTPGKFATRSRVIDEYGNPPDLRTIILRSVCRMVPFEAFSCTGDSSRGWHDRWSNTWVVTDKELLEIKKLQAEQEEGAGNEVKL